MIGMQFVTLGAILLLALARAFRMQPAPSVVIEVRDVTAHTPEALRQRKTRGR